MSQPDTTVWDPREDLSLRVEEIDLEMQRAGYVAAFRHPEVIAAIGSGMIGQIAVTYLEWAGLGSQVHVIAWTLVDGLHSAHAFADAMAEIARLVHEDPQRLRDAPRSTPVSRVDLTKAERQMDLGV